MIRKNFFGVLSTFKLPEFESREIETLPPLVEEFYVSNNCSNVNLFVYNLLVSKLIHFINTKPNYRNCGRLNLAPNRELQYTRDEIISILQLYFNREDAEATVLYITGHGNPNGEIFLWTLDGDVAVDFASIAGLWDQRTSKNVNKDLLLIVDACFAGNWVTANRSTDIFIQAACGANQKSRDIKIENNVVGSVFLHNFLMLHGVTDCFFEGVSNVQPACSSIPPDQVNRIRAVFEMEIMKRSWDEFSGFFKGDFRRFNRNGITWEGEKTRRAQVTKISQEIERVEKEKQHGFGKGIGGSVGGPIAGPMSGPLGGPVNTLGGSFNSMNVQVGGRLTSGLITGSVNSGPYGYGGPIGGSFSGQIGGPIGGSISGPSGGAIGGSISRPIGGLVSGSTDRAFSGSNDRFVSGYTSGLNTGLSSGPIGRPTDGPFVGPISGPNDSRFGGGILSGSIGGPSGGPYAGRNYSNNYSNSSYPNKK